MDYALQNISENLLNAMRGALFMLFITMSVSLYPRRKESPIITSLFRLFSFMPVLILVSLLFMLEQFQNNEYINSIKILVDLCLVPLVGAILLKIIIPDWISIRKEVLLIAPAVACLVIYAVVESKIIITISLIYTSLNVIAMIILIVYISIRYDRYLKNNFSNIDNMTVRWVRMVIYIFALWYMVWRLTVQLDNRWIDSLYYLFLIFIWTFIYKYSIKHTTTFQTRELFESTQPEAAVAPTHEYTAKEKLASTLESYINREQTWLNPTLTLHDLALALGTNRTYLSEYFNNTLETTFYDYLNGFRIKYACEILLSDSKLPLSLVGEKSGFNSLSTFRRTFEKHIGCSPTKYRSKNIYI